MQALAMASNALSGSKVILNSAITSTQKAIDTEQNKFTPGGTVSISDIVNQASYSADSVGVSLGSLSLEGSSAGIGSDSGKTASITQGAISGIAGNTTARTGDAEVGLKPIFDLDKVQKEITAQVKITQTLGQQAGQEIASYAEKQRAPLQQQLKEAKTDDERNAIQDQINTISMQERALNVLLGAVTGMGGAALTRETLQGAADTLRQMAVADSRTFAGVTDGETTLTNVSGNSEGVRGDGIKLGGTRVDLDQVCGADNVRCKTKADGSLDLDANGRVVFTGGSLQDYINSPKGSEMAGLTGGIQGWDGTLAGAPYSSGSWTDNLIESFAGTHDTLGGKWAGLYDAQGNIKQGMSKTESNLYEVWSAVAIAPSLPFAMAEQLSPEVWKAISILIGALK